MCDQYPSQALSLTAIGGFFIDGHLHFRVWAPKARKVELKIVSRGQGPLIRLSEDSAGYFSAVTDAGAAGDQYFFVLDGMDQLPDPASHFQPEGVHGPSEIVDPYSFKWHDVGWKGIPLNDLIIYELHVGTFTREGTFEAIIPMLDYMLELGITAIELMPVAQFPGSRNWGYDGVYPFAPQNSYGGPAGLKSLIDACHAKGLAVILDVVYNHLGPEGNYLNKYGYYFTDRYRTPWGDALNFDGPHSDEVRRFFISNALYWPSEFHADGLRIDAVHGIVDFSARPFLRELTDAVHDLRKDLGRDIFVIAESDLNDTKLIGVADGHYNFDAQWNDDFHHAIHALLTCEDGGYYQDFGMVAHIEKALGEGFVYSGQYSKFRKKSHGCSAKHIPPHKLIVFSQNHDQVGNRPQGDRLSRSLSFEKLKLVAGLVILSPYLPLLFMGEEYGETLPFRYFVSFIDENLARAVGEGRQKELILAGWKDMGVDPQSESAFLDSKLNVNIHNNEQQRTLFAFYKELIRLRKNLPPLKNFDRSSITVRSMETEKAVIIHRSAGGEAAFCLFNFDERLDLKISPPSGIWRAMLVSSDRQWGGEGTAPLEEVVVNGGDTIIPMQPDSFVVCHRGADD